jgi:hypothetical protein
MEALFGHGGQKGAFPFFYCSMSDPSGFFGLQLHAGQIISGLPARAFSQAERVGKTFLL